MINENEEEAKKNKKEREKKKKRNQEIENAIQEKQREITRLDTLKNKNDEELQLYKK